MGHRPAGVAMVLCGEGLEMTAAIDPVTRGAVLSQEYAEVQDQLLAVFPSKERGSLDAMLRHITRAAHKEASPDDLAAFGRYAIAAPEEARALVGALAAEAFEAAMLILEKHPGWSPPGE